MMYLYIYIFIDTFCIHMIIYIYVYICTMIVEYCTIYLFMYNICNIWIKYKWTWGCNSSERSGIQWHFAVRYSDAGKRQEWGSSATIRDYNDWALAASSKNAATRFIGFLYKQNHQMHMIWGYLSRFFGHRDSSLLRQARHLGATFSTCTVTVACSAACTLSDKGKFVRSTDCCPDVQISRCPSKTAYQWSEVENAFLLPHRVVWPQFSAHVSPATSSMNGKFWVESMSEMHGNARVRTVLSYTKSKY
jgi:hypothetical protein